MEIAWLLAALCFSGSAHADASGFVGTWKGTGTWDSGGRDNEVSTVAVLTVSVTDSAFRFEECWDYRDRYGAPKHTCILGSYERDSNDSLFHDGKKVGDIFPGKVQIFDGNTQVAEQIVMEKRGKDQLHYRYSYTNFDGALESRDATLSPVR